MSVLNDSEKRPYVDGVQRCLSHWRKASLLPQQCFAVQPLHDDEEDFLKSLISTIHLP